MLPESGTLLFPQSDSIQITSDGEGCCLPRPGRLFSIGVSRKRPKLMFLVTEDWYFVSHRLPLAMAAIDAGFDVSLATRVGRHEEMIKDSGLSLYPIPFNRSGLGPIEEFGTLARITSLYRQHRPDIVHQVALKPVVYGSIAARSTGVKGVVNALGGLGYVFSSTELKARALQYIAKPALKFSLNAKNARLIIQNDDDRLRLVKGGLAEASSVRLIRGAGVDLSYFTPGEIGR